MLDRDVGPSQAHKTLAARKENVEKLIAQIQSEKPTLIDETNINTRSLDAHNKSQSILASLVTNLSRHIDGLHFLHNTLFKNDRYNLSMSMNPNTKLVLRFALNWHFNISRNDVQS